MGIQIATLKCDLKETERENLKLRRELKKLKYLQGVIDKADLIWKEDPRANGWKMDHNYENNLVKCIQQKYREELAMYDEVTKNKVKSKRAYLAEALSKKRAFEATIEEFRQENVQLIVENSKIRDELKDERSYINDLQIEKEKIREKVNTLASELHLYKLQHERWPYRLLDKLFPRQMK